VRKSVVLFRLRLALLVATIAINALSSCADSDGALPPVARGCAARPGQRLKLVEIGRDFTLPIAVQAPLKDPRIFVAEQIGRIWQIRDGVRHGAPFLDISKLVSTGKERGLLGVAFHPDYAENGRFFVSYTDVRGDSVIAEYQAAPTAYVAYPNGVTILTVRQPAANNNGGAIAFGPDGLLYLGFGDGGGANDRFGNGQNRDSLLGKVLRIDIDSGAPYAIPPSNPWANGGGVPEMFAWGLRNPTGLAFDGSQTVSITDIGQNVGDEINVMDLLLPGSNFGWPIFDGSACLAADDVCASADVRPAAVLIERELIKGCELVAGRVYRGVCMPDLVGQYIGADACSGRVGTLTQGEVGLIFADLVVDATEIKNQLAAIGQDGFGEIYVTTRESGKVFRLQVE
jgi:glucose/arabinose dehydrogenase